MLKVFIDGREGTTGLQIEQRLQKLDIQLLEIDNELRKDISIKEKKLNEADVVFLCLPDAAAKQSVSLIHNKSTIVIDASTAHRTNPDWAYGFPELSKEHEQKIKQSKRIAVPGCHASGFCALVYPLVKNGFISSDEKLSCFSLTGYSGGGKSMISDYEGQNAPRGAKPYALTLNHKHLPEMKYICGLEHEPIFQPIVVDIRQGMIVSIPLFKSAKESYNILKQHYSNTENVTVAETEIETFFDMEANNNTDKMEIFVFGNENRTMLSARFDNLGKGASGAAVQCLKLKMQGDI